MVYITLKHEYNYMPLSITCHTEPDSLMLSEFGHNVTHTSENAVLIGVGVRSMQYIV